MLNIIDEYTRECLCIHVDRQINARKVKKIFSKLIDEHGARNTSEATTVLSLSKRVCENGWQRMRSKRSILKQDALGQNGYIESFNARLREECLNREEL